MKKFAFIFTLVLVMSRAVTAQTSNAILFTENGEKFTAILNGVKQNEKPETNVKITGLNAEFYKLKVVFENASLGEKNMNLYIHLGSETSYSIRKNNKGEYVLRLVSEVPVAQAPASTPMQTVVMYHATPQAPATGTYSTQTTTTTTKEVNPDNVSVNMGINVNDAGGSMSIQASGMDVEEETTTVTHTTTTTTTTTSNAPAPQMVSYLPGYTGPIGCPMPMAANEFQDFRSSISSKTFEDTRMTIAKQVLSDRCILASQVKEVMLLFTFEDNRLDFAKFAYDKTYDIGNYFKVNDAFTFETSVDELNQYIDSRR